VSGEGLNLLRDISRRLTRIESALAASPRADDGWTRIPGPGLRCPVSNWSGRTLYRHIKAGRVRSKMVTGSRFYAAGDVRRLLDQPTEPTEPSP
jgi:hypothetical protein